MWNTSVITNTDMLYVGALFYVYGFSIADTELSDMAPMFSWRYMTITYGATTLGNGPLLIVNSDSNLYVGAYNKFCAMGDRQNCFY